MKVEVVQKPRAGVPAPAPGLAFETQNGERRLVVGNGAVRDNHSVYALVLGGPGTGTVYRWCDRSDWPVGVRRILGHDVRITIHTDAPEPVEK